MLETAFDAFKIFGVGFLTLVFLYMAVFVSRRAWLKAQHSCTSNILS